MPPEQPTVQELTRRLLAREAALNDSSGGPALAARRACERTYHELARWVGPTGSHTLLTRAVAEAREDFPVLEYIRVVQSDQVLEGVPEIIDAHGVRPVADALESVLATLLELLARMIGADMAARLVESSAPSQSRNDERSR